MSGVGPISSSNHPTGAHKPSSGHHISSKDFDKITGSHTVLGMHLNKKEYQAFLQNESKILLTCMKEQEARLKKANEELKKALLGEE